MTIREVYAKWRHRDELLSGAESADLAPTEPAIECLRDCWQAIRAYVEAEGGKTIDVCATCRLYVRIPCALGDGYSVCAHPSVSPRDGTVPVDGTEGRVSDDGTPEPLTTGERFGCIHWLDRGVREA